MSDMTTAIETNVNRIKPDALKRRWLIIECHFKHKMDRNSISILTGLSLQEISAIILSEKDNIFQAKELAKKPVTDWQNDNLGKMEAVFRIACNTFGEQVKRSRKIGKANSAKIAFCHLCDRFGIKLEWVSEFLGYADHGYVSVMLKRSRNMFDTSPAYQIGLIQCEEIITRRRLI